MTMGHEYCGHIKKTASRGTATSAPTPSGGEVVVTDINPCLLHLADALGAIRTVNVPSESLKGLSLEEGFNIDLEMSGHPPGLEDILEHSAHGARISLLGIFPEKLEIDFNRIIFKGITLKRIYGREMFETCYKMSSMIRAGLHPTPVITRERPAADFEEAFETMRPGESGKVILSCSCLLATACLTARPSPGKPPNRLLILPGFSPGA